METTFKEQRVARGIDCPRKQMTGAGKEVRAQSSRGLPIENDYPIGHARWALLSHSHVRMCECAAHTRATPPHTRGLFVHAAAAVADIEFLL